MGRTVKKLLGAAALFIGAGLLIGPALVAGLPAAYALVGVQIFAITRAFGALTPELEGLESARDLAANLSIFSAATAVRSVAFGRVGIAGQVLFRENIENPGDTPDELLIILELAGYPCTALEEYWLNDVNVFSGSTTTGPGAITSGPFANDLWVWFRTGEETSAAFPDIATLSANWNNRTRILRGICSIGIRLKITAAVDGKFEPLAQIQGSELYDPRLDSTIPGGAGSHRFNDPTTWAWSHNPKLAELLYLRGGDVNGTNIFGMGKAAAGIDLENFAAEASVCEEAVDVVGGGTIERYSCNGLLVPEPDHRTNLRKLLSASAGLMDASGGVYRTLAGAWRASSMTLDESDIDGAPTEVLLQQSPSEKVNIISGAFADPNDFWRVKEYPELRDDTLITEVGENSKKLDLPFTTDHRIAQRISKIEMKRLNADTIFGGNYWLRAVSLQPGDIVTQTYARYTISAETFRVNIWGLEGLDDRKGNRRLVVPMQLVEELQSWFDWDELTEEQSFNSGTSLPSASRQPAIIGDDQASAISDTIEGSGRLVEDVSADDGGTFRIVTRGVEPGSARDGDSINFSPAWTNTPTVRFVPGGLNFNTSLTGDQTLDLKALNLSGSGFDADLKTKELVGATTARTDNTVSTPSVPSGLDHSINKGQTLEAHDDRYTYQFDVSFTAPVGEPDSVNVGIYSNDGSGWVLRATRMYIGDSGDPDLLNQTVVVTVNGLGLNDDFGINVESGPGTLTFDRVTYDTATAPVTESATPTGASSIDYLVLGG